MIEWQIRLMWPLLLTLLSLAGFALYVFSHSARLYRLKLLLIPALVGVTTFSFPFLASRQGYAYPEGLPESFEYVAHKLILVESRKAWIDVLVVSRKPLERDARLHRMPWSQPLEDALKQAQRLKRQDGAEIHMDRGHADEYPQWMPRRVRPQDAMPKEPLPGGLPGSGVPERSLPGAGPDPNADLLRPQGPSL